MEVFWNVLDSYIISKIESEFFGNGIFLEKWPCRTALVFLPLGILMPITQAYKIITDQFILINPIRINFCS